MKTGGYLVIFFVLFVFILAEISNVTGSWWLSVWSEATSQNNNNNGNINNMNSTYLDTTTAMHINPIESDKTVFESLKLYPFSRMLSAKSASFPWYYLGIYVLFNCGVVIFTFIKEYVSRISALGT